MLLNIDNLIIQEQCQIRIKNEYFAFKKVLFTLLTMKNIKNLDVIFELTLKNIYISNL